MGVKWHPFKSVAISKRRFTTVSAANLFHEKLSPQKLRQSLCCDIETTRGVEGFFSPAARPEATRLRAALIRYRTAIPRSKAVYPRMGREPRYDLSPTLLAPTVPHNGYARWSAIRSKNTVAVVMCKAIAFGHPDTRVTSTWDRRGIGDCIFWVAGGDPFVTTPLRGPLCLDLLLSADI